MRMWMVQPRQMCAQHLLGEHVECHMFWGTYNSGKSLKGYADKGLVELAALEARHAALAAEMERRGFKHRSPLQCGPLPAIGKVDPEVSVAELRRRCSRCEF